MADEKRNNREPTVEELREILAVLKDDPAEVEQLRQRLLARFHASLEAEGEKAREQPVALPIARAFPKIG